MTPPCASAGCTTQDVVVGLAQVSDQVHGLSAYLLVAGVFVVFCLVVLTALTWANHR